MAQEDEQGQYPGSNGETEELQASSKPEEFERDLIAGSILEGQAAARIREAS
jgi:hypothetical protein